MPSQTLPTIFERDRPSSLEFLCFCLEKRAHPSGCVGLLDFCKEVYKGEGAAGYAVADGASVEFEELCVHVTLFCAACLRIVKQ